MKKYQLIVVGGGLSGVAAAVSAAREGLKVLLIDKNGALGGTCTNSLVIPFMRYFIIKDGKRHIINDGIFLEILNSLDEMGVLLDNKLTFNEEYLKNILDRLCKSSGVDVLFHSTLISSKREGDRIARITLAGVSGLKEYGADCFIDCTGDGNLAAFSGCKFALGREEDNRCQPMTLCFRMGNIDMEKYRENREKIDIIYNEFQKQGKIRNVRENVLIFKTVHNGVLHFNTTRIINKNPIDEWELSAAEMEAREQVLEMFYFLKNNIEGFENATLLSMAHQIGVRRFQRCKNRKPLQPL